MAFNSKTLLALSALAPLILSGCDKGAEAGGEVTATAEAAAPTGEMASASSSPEATATAIPAGCQINGTSDWRASINAQPVKPPRLNVSGLVTTSSTGFKVKLERKGIDINQKVMTLELIVTPPTPGSMAGSAQTPHVIKEQFPDVNRELEKVIINCSGAKLAEITDIPILH